MVMCCSFWNDSSFVLPSNAVRPERPWFRIRVSITRRSVVHSTQFRVCVHKILTLLPIRLLAVPPTNCALKINVLSHNLFLSGSPITVLWSVGSLIFCVLQAQLIPDDGTTHGNFHYVLFRQPIPLFARILISWEMKLPTETKTSNIMVLFWYLHYSGYYAK
jgi:hypothetical protein